MDNRPVGIFDSGLGGLTAMKALQELLPQENIIYFGDTGRVPYGEKTAAQIRRMAVQDLDLVSGFGVKAVLVACGTISSNAPDILESYPVPAFGVLKSGVAGMTKTAGDGPLGVIATEASIRSGAFAAALRRACPEREILPVACPDFVPLIESGHTAADDPLVRSAVEKYLTPLRGASAVLLGCTHYGIIEDAITNCLGSATTLVSASVCAAAKVAQYLIVNHLTGGSGQERFLTSGSAEQFSRAAAAFLGHRAARPVETVPIMEI